MKALIKSERVPGTETLCIEQYFVGTKGGDALVIEIVNEASSERVSLPIEDVQHLARALSQIASEEMG